MMNEHDICDCPLCLAVDKEDPIYSDEKVKIVETKNRKGHKRRIMVIWRAHNDYHLKSENLQYMINALAKVGQIVFDYTYKFVIMSPKFATIVDHAHYVASDLEPDAEDFYQILGTPWVKVVDVKEWIKK